MARTNNGRRRKPGKRPPALVMVDYDVVWPSWTTNPVPHLLPHCNWPGREAKDVSVFTVSAVAAQGRPVPVAQNKVHFAAEGEGKIIGVGNGNGSFINL